MAASKESSKASVDGNGELSTPAAVRRAIEYIASFTGKDPIAATSVEPTESGWLVGVEILEESRIPSTSDMLALYEVELDLGGELLAYRRTQRYRRGQSDGGKDAT
jgi:Gas vesicle synthesis protein GvpO